MRHLIIGAGFSGLPIAKKLKELGEDFEVVDRNAGIGGLWHTGAYKDAHIISSKRTTEFPDFPMPETYPDFPSRAQMQAYFESYAVTFGLMPSIRLGTAVKRVRRHGDHWLVTFESGEEKTYLTVTIANGHNWQPRRVTRPGIFDGAQVQSSDYWDSSLLEGKRVLVVGYGNTGCDIAVDAGRAGTEASISMRSGAYFFPRLFMGIPVADLAMGFPLKGDWVDRLFGRVLLQLSVGDLARYGVPKPTFRPFDKHPIVNSDLIQAIRLGRVAVRPDIASFAGKTVHFVDGTSAAFDLIVWATGYQISFPMLDPEDRLIDFEGELPVLFLQTMSPKHRGLFTPGIGQARTGGGPLYQAGGYLTARMIAHEGRSRNGVMADLKANWMMRLVARFLQKDVAPADMRSRALHTYQRRMHGLSRILDQIGAPDAPSEASAPEAPSTLPRRALA